MRPLEIVLLVAIVPAVAALFAARHRRPRWLLPFAIVAVVAGVAHLLIEGYRWQMVPAYALAALFLIAALVGRRRPLAPARQSRARTVLRYTLATAGVLALVVAAVLPVLFPVFSLPKPTGPNMVGFTRFALVDSTRAESFTAEPSDKRSLMVEAWYPAASLDGPLAMFWGPRLMARRLAPALGLPSFLFDHLELVRTHAHLDAPPAGAPTSFPVLIFSHGYNQGFPGQNTTQMEELASHGYAVFSIAHPYESIAVAYPDGRVAAVSKTRMDSVGRGMRASGEALRKFAASTDRAERATLFRQAIAEPRLLHESLQVWTADTRFVMDELARRSTLGGRLDLSRMGVFGMSFGGTTAGQVCVVEPRCRAGVNLDGTQYGDPIDVPLRVPFMFMTSFIDGLNDPVYDVATGPAYSVNARGSTHFNYTDFSLLSPLFKRMGFLGPIDGLRMERILNHYLVAFFDTHLKGEGRQHAALLDSSSSVYSEVRLSSHTP